MTPWASFYDLISPDLPACPQIAQQNALRQAAIAFCEQSLAWKYDHPDIAVAAGTADYPFVPPTGAIVHTITYTEFDGSEISCTTAADDINIYDWRNQSGAPAYVLADATGLTLVPNPDANGTLKLTVALKPSRTADGIDDNIFNEYRDTIGHGALARLMYSPNKPYTNAPLAQYHGQLFKMETASAGIRAARNYTRAPLQTTIMRRR